VDATPSRRALVVDDAPEIVALIAPLLRKEGYEVSTAADGEAALEVARSIDPDQVVLDLLLPKLDGIDVCGRLRAFSDAYIVMLTARTEEVDMLVGLAVGADDYMTKPFSPREMVARVRALQRRPRRAAAVEAERRFGDLTIDVAARDVRIAGEEVTLTRIEFDLLGTLSSAPRQTFTRGMLLDAVWGQDWHGDDHLVDVHMANLRRKLGDDPRRPRFLRTVRGVGYRMQSPTPDDA
jgi:DNA-binding response OmpR family regulator